MNSSLLYFFSYTPKLKNHQNKLINTQHNQSDQQNKPTSAKQKIDN